MHIYNSWTDVEQLTELNPDIYFTLKTALQRFEEKVQVKLCRTHRDRQPAGIMSGVHSFILPFAKPKNSRTT